MAAQNTTPMPTPASLETPPTFSVDPNAAEGLLSAAQLGQRIKRLRLKRSMGLVELGKQTGLSASFLSQLETGRVVPTLRNLARISLVFGKDLSYFFEPTEQAIFRVQRKNSRVRLPQGDNPLSPDYISESFGILIPEGDLRPCRAEFLPGDEHDAFIPERKPGVEMVYVLSGELRLTRRNETYILQPSDVLYISSDTPRSYHAEGKEAAHALLITFDQEPSELRRPRKPAPVRAES
ncbi:helix-turn-helix domain-containing protein [Granulicella cerasi]|uniref:Helix-turn-helix domain-containing protein n=1 Tax=Granulicella cerasi TaxID=741063 RepID=A0ABW1Z5F0_9BACT|nr:XRE family transcriptional regulator [Granulicella cerasi]